MSVLRSIRAIPHVFERVWYNVLRRDRSRASTRGVRQEDAGTGGASNSSVSKAHRSSVLSMSMYS